MNAAFLIWDKLLLKLTEQRPSFFESLLRSIQTALDSSFHMSSDSTLEKDIIYQWQWHLLSSKKWQSSQQHFWQSEDFPSELIEACYLNPNPWTQQLAKLLLGQGEDDFRQNWTAMYNASFGVNPPEEIERNDRDDEDEKMGDTEQESPLAVDSDSDVEHSGCGWKLLDGPWIPRAIGV
jgi:hypothetical protein